jgi:hypothetical protein
MLADRYRQALISAEAVLFGGGHEVRVVYRGEDPLAAANHDDNLLLIGERLPDWSLIQMIAMARQHIAHPGVAVPLITESGGRTAVTVASSSEVRRPDPLILSSPSHSSEMLP